MLLCLSIGMIVGRALAGDANATRLGKRALLHVCEDLKRVAVPVAPISENFSKAIAVRVLSGGSETIIPRHSLNFASDACGSFIFPPPLPKGASAVFIEFDGKVVARTECAVPPDSWWPDLVCRAAATAACV